MINKSSVTRITYTFYLKPQFIQTRVWTVVCKTLLCVIRNGPWSVRGKSHRLRVTGIKRLLLGCQMGLEYKTRRRDLVYRSDYRYLSNERKPRILE